MQRLGDLVPRVSGAKEAYQEILNEPEIATILEELGPRVNLDLLPSFISDLDEYVRNRKKCLGCSGIDYCKQPVKGHHPQLEEKLGRLKIIYVPCHFEKNQMYLENIKSFHIPKDALKADFDSVIMDPQRLEVYEKSLMFIHDYLTTKKGMGLYIHGPFGTGKTYFLSAIANALGKQGVVCGLVYFPELIAEIKSSFNSDDNASYSKVEQLKTIDVLMIDDIGSESMTSWMRDEILGRILNYRMQQGLPTFFTSNLNYDQLQQHYSYTQKGEVEVIKGARIMERIKALTVPVELKGSNHRER